ncbi:MAG: hypothetical protein INR71_01295 [Terriglobus roseus]|nr:hypothetical protein [Terriglobus roseus]
MPALTHPSPNTSHSAVIANAPRSSPEALSEKRVRLHITPFKPDLLSKIIPPALQPEAANISFHHTQVSPERGFGYVELPAMAAEKLKKKLNGAILKGEKVKVQDAKPEKRRHRSDADAHDAPKSEKREKKKRKITEKVEEGVELSEGRKVKRGWTETPAEKRDKASKSRTKKKDAKEKKNKDKEKKRESSKYTTEPELLFKTKLEPTAATAQAAKKSKPAKEGKPKKDMKSTTDTVVHEFENTKKYASFLKSSQVDADSKLTSEYVDGKGWVDTDGNLVEAEKKTKGKKRKAKKEATPLVPSVENTRVLTPEPQDDTMDLDKADPQPTAAAEPAAVHPLEALFKRSKPDPNSTPNKKALPPIDTSKAAFSFFEAEANSDNDAATDSGAAARPDIPSLTIPPMTPMTKHDFNMRGLRSAAPEPDTATQERRFSFAAALDDIQEGEDEVDSDAGVEDAQTDDRDDEDMAGAGAGAAPPGPPREESEWRKWFYEHRGENNRAWRQKRREGMKLKRQRENRRVARRAVA